MKFFYSFTFFSLEFDCGRKRIVETKDRSSWWSLLVFMLVLLHDGSSVKGPSELLDLPRQGVRQWMEMLWHRQMSLLTICNRHSENLWACSSENAVLVLVAWRHCVCVGGVSLNLMEVFFLTSVWLSFGSRISEKKHQWSLKSPQASSLSSYLQNSKNEILEPQRVSFRGQFIIDFWSGALKKL